uniref:Uncharacterized protein n=1 Tax=Anguilla anguilla TaxID=7936 RepID=A0A0E9PQ84_ANGAN
MAWLYGADRITWLWNGLPPSLSVLSDVLLDCSSCDSKAWSSIMNYSPDIIPKVILQ